MNINDYMNITSSLIPLMKKEEDLPISGILEEAERIFPQVYDEKISYLKHVQEVFVQAFQGISLTDLNMDQMRSFLSKFCTSSFSELCEQSPLTLTHARDEMGFTYQWTVQIEIGEEADYGASYDISERLIRTHPDKALYEELWDSREMGWIGNDPADYYDFDRELLPILERPSSERALFMALVSDPDIDFVTVEDWNRVLAANDFLLHLANQLPKDCVEFSSTEVGLCLLPVKKQLVGLGISQYDGKLFLVEHLPERARERILNIDRDSDDTLAETICRVSLKQAQNFLLARDYPVSDDPDSLSLYLPLSKTRIIYEETLPLQSTREAFVEKYKKEGSYQDEEEFFLDCFIDFLFAYDDDDDYDDDDEYDDDDDGDDACDYYGFNPNGTGPLF